MFKFLSKKKPTFKARCMLSQEALARESTRLITTADIISSKKFWDNVMTEPDTLGYTKAYFESGDATAANIRKMIFQKYSKEDKIWSISDSQLHLFDVDENKAKEHGMKWWDNQGDYKLEDEQYAMNSMPKTEIEACESYALKEAGRVYIQN